MEKAIDGAPAFYKKACESITRSLMKMLLLIDYLVAENVAINLNNKSFATDSKSRLPYCGNTDIYAAS